MDERYDKDNILEIPVLVPERHYESEQAEKEIHIPYQPRKHDKMLDSLDDLDNLYRICDLLPPDLAETIRIITDVLSKHTQGLIIMRLERNAWEPPATTPESIPPKVPPVIGPETDKPKPPPSEEGTITDPPLPRPEEWIPHPPGWHPPKWPDSGKGGKKWPPKFGKPTEGTTTITEIYTGGSDGGTITEVYMDDGHTKSVMDTEVDDIFSEDPDIEVNVLPSDSLVDLARQGYEQDDADIKEHYTNKMTQASQRFFQVMTALAEDANLLDYSNLMQDFDGTAVKTTDPGQLHLIDEISRNQVLYDQKLRQMNLTHTAEKTLVMTRAMTAAEGERERYLKTDYKKDMPTISAGLSNDLLQKAREDAEKKYKEAAYNMYKYLDSAAKYTQTMLNMKIDSAAAKAQLANTGSDIFAVTPPPQPTENHVDTNFDTTIQHQMKQQDMIDQQKKDAKKGSEVDNGSSFGGASAGSLGGGNVDPAAVYKFLKGQGYNAIAACGIMGNIQQESGFNTDADDSVEAFGLCQWTAGRQAALKELASSTGRSPLDAGAQLDYLWQELQGYEELLPPSLNHAGSAGEAAQIFEVQFERAGVPMMENRISYAEGFYAQFRGK